VNQGEDSRNLFRPSILKTKFVTKLDQEGKPLPTYALGVPTCGARGTLRVSHRELDDQLTTLFEPYLTHANEKLLMPGEIVSVEIPIWPMGMKWHAGEKLQLTIQGYAFTGIEDQLLPKKIFKHEIKNRGDHTILTGEKYNSHLLVPVIPPKDCKA